MGYGGEVLIGAGMSTAKSKAGGSVILAAGERSNEWRWDSINGGKVATAGGGAKGNFEWDDGGEVKIQGGYSIFGLSLIQLRCLALFEF